MWSTKRFHPIMYPLPHQVPCPNNQISPQIHMLLLAAGHPSRATNVEQKLLLLTNDKSSTVVGQ